MDDPIALAEALGRALDALSCWDEDDAAALAAEHAEAAEAAREAMVDHRRAPRAWESGKDPHPLWERVL